VSAFADKENAKAVAVGASRRQGKGITMSAAQSAEERFDRIHPGEILREDFLLPMGITAYRLAKSIGVPQTRVAQILKGERAITADTALRLARFFGTSPQLWINLQSHYDLEVAERANAEAYSKIPAFA
jgi:addiction module HigA family antidote